MIISWVKHLEYKETYVIHFCGNLGNTALHSNMRITFVFTIECINYIVKIKSHADIITV